MPVESRKVFISWSRNPTDVIATSLAQFLNHMFDNVEPFVSKDNVAFGSLSIGEIHRQLAGTTFGILIVTRANQSEPWLNFEAGSLAKTIPDDGDARVVPLLIDHDSIAQLTGPIANLQAVIADEDGCRRLLSELADTLGVDAAVFESRWATGWARFQEVLRTAREVIAEGPTAPERSPDDMLEEIVTLLRNRPTLDDGPERVHKSTLTLWSRIMDVASADGFELKRAKWTDGGGPKASLQIWIEEVDDSQRSQWNELQQKIRAMAPERRITFRENHSLL